MRTKTRPLERAWRPPPADASRIGWDCLLRASARVVPVGALRIARSKTLLPRKASVCFSIALAHTPERISTGLCLRPATSRQLEISRMMTEGMAARTSQTSTYMKVKGESEGEGER